MFFLSRCAILSDKLQVKRKKSGKNSTLLIIVSSYVIFLMERERESGRKGNDFITSAVYSVSCDLHQIDSLVS